MCRLQCVGLTLAAVADLWGCHMQAAKAAAEAAESAALAAEDGARMSSPMEATSKASAAAWRASQAAAFESAAEAEALQAASHAKVAGTAQAVAASTEAAQHYNLVGIGLCLSLAGADAVRQDLAGWAAPLLCGCQGPACQHEGCTAPTCELCFACM